MKNKKIIAIFGATGGQGGGLANAILNDPESEFAVRAITRNPDSEKSKALAAKGAEIFTADIDDPESINKALEGAYGAYFVTFFWDHFSPEKEIEEAKSMAKAAGEAGLKHAIWSTLEDTRLYVPLSDNRMPTLLGKYKVPHFDGKGESDQFFREAGVPTTFLLTSFYWDNFISLGMGPKRGEDGKLALTLPLGAKNLSGIAVEDIGKCAYGIFQKGETLIGKTVGIAGGHLTGQDLAKGFENALGEEVRYNGVSTEVYRNFGFPGADDLGNMFQFYQDFADDFGVRRNVEFSRKLNPELQSFEMWLKSNVRQKKSVDNLLILS